MIKKKNTIKKLNIDTNDDVVIENIGKNMSSVSDADKILMNSMKKFNKWAVLAESGPDVEMLRSVMHQLGIEPVGKYDPRAISFMKRVDIYVERFPEIEYLIDMIASSIIYTSSSNTKKIEVILNGEYEVEQQENQDQTTTEYTPNVEVNDVVINENVVLIDSFQKNISIEINNLFKQNNVKLALYEVIFSILKYGIGIFYIDDDKYYNEVSFYSLDKVNIEYFEDDKFNNNYALNQFTQSVDSDDDTFRKVKNKKIKITVKEDGKKLKNKNVYFITDRDVFGKSLVSKIINYLKVIELLELSLLIERLSKSKNLFVQKLDMEKIEEEDVSATLLLYKNIIKSKTSFEYDEDNDQIYLDIVKTLVDNNIVVPVENDNLKIDTLKSEYKPLLDDINYYQDKIYHTLGIPLHYRKGTDSKSYLNNNMLTMHDNVYAMKIRRYQAVINQILTFQVERQIESNYSNVTLNYIYVNIPEFVPVSERKETDLDKATKYVSMFSQLQQLLGIDVKREFILNKLFPNDIITDIVDIQPETETQQSQPTETEQPTEEEDIVSLFESGLSNIIKNERKNRLPQNVRFIDNKFVYSYNFVLNIKQ